MLLRSETLELTVAHNFIEFYLSLTSDNDVCLEGDFSSSVVVTVGSYLMENKDKLSIRNWEPNALIYEYNTPSFNAYYIIEGQVDIFTPRGLKLNSIGPSEVFGEASLLLDKKRSVTARAGTSGVKTKLVPKSYITDLQKSSPILSALLRNVQMRLVDSNEQSARYAKDIEKLIKLTRKQNEVSRAVTDKLTTIQKRIENDFFSDY